MNNNQMLEAAFIPEEYWVDCFIDDGGKIYPPLFNRDGTIRMSGAEAKEWFDTQSNTPSTPSSLDILGAQVAQLSIDNMQKDRIINALGAQLAQTSLDVMALKNGGM